MCSATWVTSERRPSPAIKVECRGYVSEPPLAHGPGERSVLVVAVAVDRSVAGARGQLERLRLVHAGLQPELVVSRIPNGVLDVCEQQPREPSQSESLQHEHPLDLRRTRPGGQPLPATADDG